MCYCQQRKNISVDDALENTSNLGIYHLFQQTSSNTRLNLSTCESIGFTSSKTSSVILNSTGCLNEADEAITKEGVYKLKRFADSYNVNLTDEEAMINSKPVKRLKQLKKSFRRFLQSLRHHVAALRIARLQKLPALIIISIFDFI